MNNTKSTVFILGTDFSKCADLPVQAEFSSLLTSSEFNTKISCDVMKSEEARISFVQLDLEPIPRCKREFFYALCLLHQIN